MNPNEINLADQAVARITNRVRQSEWREYAVNRYIAHLGGHTENSQVAIFDRIDGAVVVYSFEEITWVKTGAK